MTDRFGKQFIDKVIEKIGIEKSQRSFYDSFVVICHYLIDYIIIWLIISNRIRQYTPPIDFIMPFAIARIGLALGFIIFRSPLFFTLNKVVITVQLIITQ